MQDNLKPTICIIDGVARSGTTFAGAVLNTLPGAYFLTDTFKLPQYYREMHGVVDFPFSLSAARKPNDMDFAKAIPNFGSFVPQCVDEIFALLKDDGQRQKLKDKIRDKALKEINLSYVKIFSIFYETLAEEFNVNIVGGKTTFCHNYRDQMLLTIPNLKWIDIVRDVRAVMCSGISANMYDWNQLYLDEPWREHVQSLRRSKKIAPQVAQRHLVIVYRDLILNKKQTILKIVDFLGIKDFDYDHWERQPVLKNDGSAFGSHSSFDEEGNPKGNKDFRDGVQAFDTTPVKRWETKLSLSQKWLLTTLYKKELKYLNLDDGGMFFPVNPVYIWLYLKICLGRMLRFLITGLKKYI